MIDKMKSALDEIVRKKLLVSIVVFCTCCLQAHANCSSEIRILGDDLINIRLSSHQNQLLADYVLRAKRHCYRGEEKKALTILNKARELAGLEKTTGEFDWENIPIEDLIKNPEN